jgi:hypothetical protein
MTVRTLLARPLPAAAATTVVLLPLLLATVLIWTSGPSPEPVDFTWFGPGGAELLTGRWNSVFGEPAVQAGPFELLPFGVAQVLGVSGVLGWTVVLTASAAASAFLTALVLRPRFAPDLRSSVLAAGGTLVVSLAGAAATWTLGHPAEALIPLLWVAAGRLALRDRPVLAAVLVAASTGFEVWGVLGAPVVLLAAHPRFVRSALAGIAALAVLWLPFAVAGPFRMFSFAWPVLEHSLLHQLQPEATTFPWSLRVLQALVSVVAGTGVALLLRRRDRAWGPWAVTVAVVAGRLVLDPVLATYYWVPVLTGATGALVLAAHRRDLLAAAVCSGALLLAAETASPVLRAAALVGLALVAAAAASRRTGRHRLVRASPLRRRQALQDA